jgi:hypothetical protein
VRDYLPARHRTGHLRHLMLALEKPAAGQATDLGVPLKRIAEIVRKRGLLILLSDFLAPMDRLQRDPGARPGGSDVRVPKPSDVPGCGVRSHAVH